MNLSIASPGGGGGQQQERARQKDTGTGGRQDGRGCTTGVRKSKGCCNNVPLRQLGATPPGTHPIKALRRKGVFSTVLRRP